MGFLNPLLWLGVLAVAFPIWLHLRDRRVERVVRLPTLRFLSDEPAPASRPVRLRNPLLLLVRALALIAIAAAFARPWIGDDERAALTESRVHVLDNTLSHQADGGFERERERVASRLAASDGSSEHAVVELGATPRVIARFGDDPAAAAQRVRALEPSGERGSYLAAARLAGSLIDRALGERRVIEFHGDGQKNQWAEGENALPFLAGVEVEVASPPALAQRPNLALLFPEARRGWKGDVPTVELTFQVRYDEHRAARVEVRTGAAPIVSERVELPALPEGTASGTLTVRAAWPADPAAWAGGVVSVSGEPDALAGDDRAWFAVPPLSEGRVALLARSRYLATALEPEVMKGRWSVRTIGTEPPREAESSDDVLLVEASYLPSPPVAERATKMLASGRGVVVVVDHASPLVANALRALGVELESTRELGPFAGEDLAFRYVAAHHPVFRPFLAGGLGEVADAHIFKYFPLATDRVQTLVYSAQGDPLVAEVPGRRGRLLLLAFPLEREHTDWPLQTSFLPFLDQVLAYVRKQGDDADPSAPGEWCALPVASDRGIRRLVLSGSDGFRQELDAAAGDVVRLRAPARPGLYEVRSEAGLERLLAVNPAAAESALVYDADPRAIAGWKSGHAQEGEAGVAPPARPAGAEEQTWWHALLLAALALLAIELAILSLHRKRRAAA
jgi:hypothetical protein